MAIGPRGQPKQRASMSQVADRGCHLDGGCQVFHEQ